MLLHETVAHQGGQLQDCLTALADLRSHVTDLHQQLAALQERLTTLDAALSAAITTAPLVPADPRGLGAKGRK